MKIGIISDTHGCYETWRHVYQTYFTDADLIIHAGDILYHGPRNPILPEYNPGLLAEALNQCPVPLIVAAGNCDADVDSLVLSLPVQAPYAQVWVNGMRIIAHHGHTLREEDFIRMADQWQAKLIITGHTHEALVRRVSGAVHVNPGSPALSKRADKRATAAWLIDQTVQIFDIHTGEIISEDKVEG